MAQAEIDANGFFDNAIIILISDGAPNQPGSGDQPSLAALAAANAAKAAGTEIYTVAFGSDTAGKDLLAEMATDSQNDDPIEGENFDGDHFFIAAAPADLESIFEEITDDIATDLVPPVITVLGDNPATVEVGDTYVDDMFSVALGGQAWRPKSVRPCWSEAFSRDAS